MKKLWHTYLAAVLLAGCIPANTKHPKLDLVECYAHALAPHVGEVFDATELAKDITSGKAVLPAIVKNLMLSDEETQKLLTDLLACREPTKLPPTQIGS